MSIGYVWLVLYRCLLGGKGLRGMVMVTEYCTVRGCISVGGVMALGVEGKKKYVQYDMVGMVIS